MTDTGSIFGSASTDAPSAFGSFGFPSDASGTGDANGSIFGNGNAPSFGFGNQSVPAAPPPQSSSFGFGDQMTATGPTMTNPTRQPAFGFGEPSASDLSAAPPTQPSLFGFGEAATSAPPTQPSLFG